MLLTESGIVQLRNNLLESNGNTFTFRCACLPLDIETGNGRVYPTDVVSKALIEARQPMINNELACTCNDHPEEINPIPRDISHVVKDAWIDNGYVYMTAEIVETQSGKDLKALIESNIPIGISVRGTGDVVGNKVTNYTYLGADFVATPSTGLRVYPECISGKRTVYESKKITESQGVKRMSNLSAKDLINLLSESMNKIKSAKTLSQKQGIVNLTESKLTNYTILESNDVMGLQAIIPVIQEWIEIKIDEVEQPMEMMIAGDITEENVHSANPVNTPVVDVNVDNQPAPNDNAGVEAAAKAPLAESKVNKQLAVQNDKLIKENKELRYQLKSLSEKATQLRESALRVTNKYRSKNNFHSQLINTLTESFKRDQKSKAGLIESLNKQVDTKQSALIESRTELKKQTVLAEKLTNECAATRMAAEDLATQLQESYKA